VFHTGSVLAFGVYQARGLRSQGLQINYRRSIFIMPFGFFTVFWTEFHSIYVYKAYVVEADGGGVDYRLLF